ncbi:DUF3592 domain-containing protein [Hyalangium versicolor]|uniref:DUF3592 domain-containing protein n=1 Tax=Hyalangium versicolor TaxID=2861190 RepID=UPI001CCD6A40|nr:DUF3592 domain-containing protein [Hyalangium versicolor]
MWLLWGVLHFICAVFAVTGIAFLVAGLKDAWKAARTRSWPTAPGIIVSAEELQHSRQMPAEAGGGSRIHYEARIHYEYTVGRVHIGSTVVRLGPTESTHEVGVQSTLARYLPGQQVRVSYNPGDPTDSVLEPGLRPLDFTRAIVGLVLLGVAVSMELVARWFAAKV